MRIICPYTYIHPPTRKALADYEVDYIKMTGPFSYYELLKSLWEKPEDVIIVEHDVIIHDKVISEFETCPEVWCGFGYPNPHTVCIGCSKLTAEHMRQIPDLWDRIFLRNWRNLDGHHASLYDKLGLRPHQHTPVVVNDNQFRVKLDKTWVQGV